MKTYLTMRRRTCKIRNSFYIQKNATETEIELGCLPDLIKKVQFGIMP